MAKDIQFRLSIDAIHGENESEVREYIAAILRKTADSILAPNKKRNVSCGASHTHEEDSIIEPGIEDGDWSLQID